MREGPGADTVPPFRVERLTLEQIRALYAQRLKRDFPPDELKPLERIERGLERGEYVCYGALEGKDVLAYAFFVISKRWALFDYFAVKRERRDRGIGSRFIRRLIEGPLAEMDCVLLEVDDPDLATDPGEAALRERRLAFYLRNGLVDTGVRAEVYRVGYRVLALPIGERLPPERVRDVYGALYHIVLPQRLFEKWVVI